MSFFRRRTSRDRARNVSNEAALFFFERLKFRFRGFFGTSDFEIETMEMKKRGEVWPLEIIDKVLFLRVMRAIDLEIGFKMELSTFSFTLAFTDVSRKESMRTRCRKYSKILILLEIIHDIAA